MTNINKLKELGILEGVRKNQGAKSHDDDTYDNYINEMTNSELVEEWCNWHLGNGSLWTTMKYQLDMLNKLDGY